MLDQAYRDREATLAEAERILTFDNQFGLDTVFEGGIAWGDTELDCEALDKTNTVALVDAPEDDADYHTMVSHDLFRDALEVLTDVYGTSSVLVKVQDTEGGPILVQPAGADKAIAIAPRLHREAL